MEKSKDKLYTPYGEELLSRMEREPGMIPLPEYPRPQMVRDSYLCLNGWWEYAAARNSEGPLQWDRILVPFSPEAPLSTAGRMIMPEDRLYYRRPFSLPEGFNRGRVFLHFDAVDYSCRVILNGREAGQHKGGYYAFSLDITALLEQENILELEVTDPTDTSYIARGKQRLHRGTIWYTPQSGIWQTVWIESVPEEYIESFRITPDIDRKQVLFTMESSLSDGEIIISDGQEEITRGPISGKSAVISFPDFTLWSPENPKLYNVEILAGKDRVKSYMGMRKFSVGNDSKGIARLFLNNRPYFHNGVLDQGYYPDGLLTPPSDEAMVNDVQTMKDLGFNMLRKHIKIEPLRWYYHCDRLGMIVWQDFVNGGRNRFILMTLPVLSHTGLRCKDSMHLLFGRQEQKGREEFMTDAARTVSHLYNAVSIGMWVPFNESWGQFDADRAAEWLMSEDRTRTIDRYSGWYDQGHSDFRSLHVYFRPFTVPRRNGKCLILSEFGGYSCKVQGHHFVAKKDFGYKKFDTTEELSRGYKELFEKEIIPAVPGGLSASVYTQLSDVEDEVNGILTYDRKVAKIAYVKDVNRAMQGKDGYYGI